MQIESSQRGFEYGVRHLRSSEPISLDQLLNASLDLLPTQVRELLTFGSIYIDGHRLLQMPSEVLPPGTLVRIHTKPRRYPMESLKLEQIIYEDSEFLVFNKPSGIPVHATVDNFSENVIGFLKSHGREVFTTHRLDVATTGLLVIAKTIEFQKYFNHIIAKNLTTKMYRALTHGNPLKLGLWTHYMESSPRAPKKITNEALPQWLRCDLEILESQKVSKSFSESKIQLLTGRTHQIRTQASFENSPIVGDQMYGSTKKISDSENICLQASELSFPDRDGESRVFKLADSPWSYQTLELLDQN